MSNKSISFKIFTSLIEKNYIKLMIKLNLTFILINSSINEKKFQL